MYLIDSGKKHKAEKILKNGLTNTQYKTGTTIYKEFYPILNKITRSHPFHGIHHPIDDVIPNVVILAEKEGIKGQDLMTLYTSAILHDIGYLVQYLGHEDISAKIARANLPYYEFSDDQINQSERIIHATELRRGPEKDDILQQLMCDGDLSNLGENFLSAGFAMLKETMIHLKEMPELYTLPKTLLEWYERQLEFIQNHKWYTNAAKDLFGESKEANIADLKSRIHSIESGEVGNLSIERLLEMNFKEAWKFLDLY